MAPTRERRFVHDPGVVLRDLIVAIAEGGDCITKTGGGELSVWFMVDANGGIEMDIHPSQQTVE